ncbi:hypothetical protein DXG01_002542 [Tephrocybe rancida]|nr:hypothetical protein DXG01_002542 [Tephrocybe rancida]
MSSSTPLALSPRSYEAVDLLFLSKAQLVKLVKVQFDRWPQDVVFDARTNIKALTTALLDPYNGFTTTQPLKSLDFHRNTGAATRASVSLYIADQLKQPPEHAAPNLEGLPTAAPLPPPQITDSSIAPADPFPNSTFDTQANVLPPQFVSAETSDTQKLMTIFIEDLRYIPPKKIMVELLLAVGGYFESQNGAWISWCILSRELLIKLQESNCRISGTGQVTVATIDFDHTGFTHPFAHAEVAQLTLIVPDPLFIVIPVSSNPSLTIYVYGKIIMPPKLNAPLPGPEMINLLESLEQIQPLSKPRLQAVTEMALVISKLSALVAEHPDHKLFRSACSSPNLQNSQVVRLWRFISTSWEEYYIKDCSIIMNDPALAGKKIPPECIYRALGIRDTSVRQAIAGLRLIDTYHSSAAEVAQELATVRDPPHGRVKLFAFLQNWAKTHPLLPPSELSTTT